MRAISAGAIVLGVACSPFAGDANPSDAGSSSGTSGSSGQVDRDAGPNAPDGGDSAVLSPSERYAKAVVDDGAVGYWRCRPTDVTDTTLRSWSGKDDTDAKLEKDGPKPIVGGLFADGGECPFTGKNESGQVSTLAFLLADYTLEAWIKPTQNADGNYRHVFQHSAENGENTDGFGLFLHDYEEGKGSEIAAEEFIGGQHLLVHVPLPINGQWHHVAVTKGPVLYFDGAPVGTLEPAEDLEAEFVQPFTWGRKGGPRKSIFGGLTEIAVYPKALSAETIKAHYHLVNP